MAIDDRTYGFTKADAQDLVQLIDLRDREHLEGLVRDSGGGGGGKILYSIDSVTTAGTGSPYNGLRVATVTVIIAPCDRLDLKGTSQEVVDWLGCLFNEPDADLTNRKGTAFEGDGDSLADGAAPGTATGCHWVADALCC